MTCGVSFFLTNACYKSIVTIVNSRRSHIPRVMDLVCHLTILSLNNNINIWVRHIPGKRNVSANSLSWVQFDQFRMLARHADPTPRLVPEALSQSRIIDCCLHQSDLQLRWKAIRPTAQVKSNSWMSATYIKPLSLHHCPCSQLMKICYCNLLLRDGPLFFLEGVMKYPEKNCLQAWKGEDKKFADQLIHSLICIDNNTTKWFTWIHQLVWHGKLATTN